MTSPIRVTVWGENFHERAERDRAGMAERYPDGMHGAIAAGLTELLGDAVDDHHRYSRSAGARP